MNRRQHGNPLDGAGAVRGKPLKADFVCGLFYCLRFEFMNDLDQLVQDAHADFAQAAAPAELENAKARYLGKSGRLTEQLKGLGALPADHSANDWSMWPSWERTLHAPDHPKLTIRAARRAQTSRGTGRGCNW